MYLCVFTWRNKQMKGKRSNIQIYNIDFQNENIELLPEHLVP